MKKNAMNPVQQRLLWVVPSLLMTVHFLYWPLVRGTSIAFPVFVAVIPFLFGLLMVGTATRIWHLWSWTIPMPHVCFLWAAYTTLGPLVLNDTISMPFSAMGVVKMSLLTGFISAVTGTVIDTISMDERLLTVHSRVAALGVGTVKTVISYSFLFFGAFGLFIGPITKVGHYYLVELGDTSRIWLLIVLTIVPTCALFLAYFALASNPRGTPGALAAKQQPDSAGSS
ncbi:hypothetical protein WME94_30010 [Sorangium sp. So ce429]